MFDSEKQYKDFKELIDNIKEIDLDKYKRDIQECLFCETTTVNTLKSIVEAINTTK